MTARATARASGAPWRSAATASRDASSAPDSAPRATTHRPEKPRAVRRVPSLPQGAPRRRRIHRLPSHRRPSSQLLHANPTRFADPVPRAMATLPRLTPLIAPLPKLRHLRRERLRLRDGGRTTLYVARYDLNRFELRVVRLPRPAPLERFCRENGFDEALVGGFYERPDLVPLGELRTGGVARRHVPFTAPFDDVRACISIQGRDVAIARRGDLPATPTGDLLQAG